MLYLHTSALLRRARGEMFECDDELDTILVEAALGRRRIWMSSLAFVELIPSPFTAGRFRQCGRLRPSLALAGDVRLARPEHHAESRKAPGLPVAAPEPAAATGRSCPVHAAVRRHSNRFRLVGEGGRERPQSRVSGDRRGFQRRRGGTDSLLLRLQDYVDDTPPDSDVMAAVRLARAAPAIRSRQERHPVPVAENLLAGVSDTGAGEFDPVVAPNWRSLS